MNPSHSFPDAPLTHVSGTATGASNKALVLQLLALRAKAWALRRSDPIQAIKLATGVYQSVSAQDDMRVQGLLILAFCSIDTSEFDRAAAYLDQTEPFLSTLADSAALASITLLRGVLACRRGDYQGALIHLGKALTQSTKAKRRDLEALVLMRLGEVHGYQSDLERSRAYFERASVLMNQHGDALDRSELALLQSRTYRLMGDYRQALAQGLEALQAKRELSDRLGEVYALNNLGLIFHDPHDSAQALTYYLEGLARSELLADRRVRLALLGNLGELYGDLGDLDKALLCTQESLELSAAIGSLHTLGISLEGMGVLQARRGNPHEALTFYHRALVLQEQIGDLQGQASTRRNLANAHAMLVEYERALGYFKQSLALARQIKHRYAETEVLHDLGTFYAESGQPQEAKSHLHDALELAQTMGLTKWVRDCAEVLYRLYKAEGDSDRALTHFEQVYAASQKLTNEVSARRTQRLLVQFELEQARKDAESERVRSVELAEANTRLEARDRENTQLLTKLKRQAQEDDLTSLPNRRCFSDALKKAFHHATRYERPLSVAIADIDNFKQINDHFSHAVGDEVLKMVATILVGAIREGDLVARIGGEEFAFVLPETVGEEGAVVCERVRRSVAEHDWSSLHRNLIVTLSVGLTWDMAVVDAGRMLAQADTNLYEAKRAGKDKVV